MYCSMKPPRGSGERGPCWAILVDGDGVIRASDPVLGRWVCPGDGRVVGRKIQSLSKGSMQRALERVVVTTFARQERYEKESMIAGCELQFRGRFIPDPVSGMGFVIVLVEDCSSEHRTVRSFMSLRKTHAVVQALTDDVFGHAVAIREQVEALCQDGTAAVEQEVAISALRRGVDRLLSDARAWH